MSRASPAAAIAGARLVRLPVISATIMTIAFPAPRASEKGTGVSWSPADSPTGTWLPRRAPRRPALPAVSRGNPAKGRNGPCGRAVEKASIEGYRGHGSADASTRPRPWRDTGRVGVVDAGGGAVGAVADARGRPRNGDRLTTPSGGDPRLCTPSWQQGERWLRGWPAAVRRAPYPVGPAGTQRTYLPTSAVVVGTSRSRGS